MVQPRQLVRIREVERRVVDEVVAVCVPVNLAVLPEVIEIKHYEAPAADDRRVIPIGHAERGDSCRLVDFVHVVIAKNAKAGEPDASPPGETLRRSGVRVAEVAELPDGVDAFALRHRVQKRVETAHGIWCKAVMQVGDDRQPKSTSGLTPDPKREQRG